MHVVMSDLRVERDASRRNRRVLDFLHEQVQDDERPVEAGGRRQDTAQLVRGRRHRKTASCCH